MMRNLLAAAVCLAVVTLGPFSVRHAADACPLQATEAKVAPRREGSGTSRLSD